MPRVEYTNANPVWQIDYEVGNLTIDDHFRDIMDAVNALNSMVPLVTILVNRDIDENHLYHYSFVTKDGRVWEQTLRFNGGGVQQTFNVMAPGFKEEEFILHRELRDTIINLIENFRMYHFECTWV